MRSKIICLLVILMTGMAAAQTESQTATPAQDVTAVSATTLDPQFGSQSEFTFAKSNLREQGLASMRGKLKPLPTESTCLFIRSYIFERQDGQAPVLKGETVCTPSNRGAVRRATETGARFIPLSYY